MKVDPDTMRVVRDIAKRVASVRVMSGRMRSHQLLPGERRSIHRGDGDEFDGHDLYTYGDDPRTIDWNATAATGGQQVFIGLYKAETDMRATIVCDVSDSMNFGTARVTKRVLAAELAACAVQSMGLTHDPVALVTYSKSGVERRVKSGPAASMILPVILHTLQSKAKERPGQHSGLAKSLQLLPRSPSLVFVISDFLNVTEADWEALRKAGRRHRVFARYVQDRRERELPKAGFLPVLFTVRDADGRYRDVLLTRSSARAHAAKFQQHEAVVLERLKECRADVVTVVTDEGREAASRVINALSAPTR